MDHNDLTFTRHLACLASLGKPASHPSTPTVAIPLKLVASSDKVKGNVFTLTDNIPLKGKALSVISKWATKKSHLFSTGNRIEILENQVTDLSSISLIIKFDLLLSMLTPLITTHSVVCTLSQATEITPFFPVQDSQVYFHLC